MTDGPIKIDAGSVFRCKLPPPNHRLIEKMAEAGYYANEEREFVVNPKTDEPAHHPWSDQPEEFKETMRAEARAMYAALALEAGAKPEGIAP